MIYYFTKGSVQLLILEIRHSVKIHKDEWMDSNGLIIADNKYVCLKGICFQVQFI
ncbi:hypothetical protein ACIQ57_01890 [Lysinibacillus xylanilyticus]|uniref:hypothetical protein n=1 Tax=Lysinibacillus xylanilyticus TaxID=582475 RepID=UPI00382BE23C